MLSEILALKKGMISRTEHREERRLIDNGTWFRSEDHN